MHFVFGCVRFSLFCLSLWVAQVNSIWMNSFLASNHLDILWSNQNTIERRIQRNQREERKNDTNLIFFLFHWCFQLLLPFRFFEISNRKRSFHFEQKGMDRKSSLFWSNLQMCCKYYVNMQIKLILKIDWHRARLRYNFAFDLMRLCSARTRWQVFVLMQMCKMNVHVCW